MTERVLYPRRVERSQAERMTSPSNQIATRHLISCGQTGRSWRGKTDVELVLLSASSPARTACAVCAESVVCAYVPRVRGGRGKLRATLAPLLYQCADIMKQAVCAEQWNNQIRIISGFAPGYESNIAKIDQIKSNQIKG